MEKTFYSLDKKQTFSLLITCIIFAVFFTTISSLSTDLLDKIGTISIALLSILIFFWAKSKKIIVNNSDVIIKNLFYLRNRTFRLKEIIKIRKTDIMHESDFYFKVYIQLKNGKEIKISLLNKKAREELFNLLKSKR